MNSHEGWPGCLIQGHLAQADLTPETLGDHACDQAADRAGAERAGCGGYLPAMGTGREEQIVVQVERYRIAFPPYLNPTGDREEVLAHLADRSHQQAILTGKDEVVVAFQVVKDGGRKGRVQGPYTPAVVRESSSVLLIGSAGGPDWNELHHSSAVVLRRKKDRGPVATQIKDDIAQSEDALHGEPACQPRIYGITSPERKEEDSPDKTGRAQHEKGALQVPPGIREQGRKNEQGCKAGEEVCAGPVVIVFFYLHDHHSDRVWSTEYPLPAQLQYPINSSILR